MKKSAYGYRDREFVSKTAFQPFASLPIRSLAARLAKARGLIKRMERRPGFPQELLDIARSHAQLLEERHMFLSMPEEFNDPEYADMAS